MKLSNDSEKMIQILRKWFANMDVEILNASQEKNKSIVVKIIVNFSIMIVLEKM